MTQIVPEAVERYLASLNRASDPILDGIRADGLRDGLPIVDAEVGALLETLVVATGATRVLEIGTAIGYSTIWLARSMAPGGMLITLEVDADRAATARGNIERAGLADCVNVILGDAQRYLHKLSGPFDLIFQDGDKKLYGPLHDRLVSLLRPGGVIVTDNVLWSGEVVPGLVDPPQRGGDDTAAIAAYNERIASDARLVTSIVPLRDGLSISAKRRTQD